MRALRNTACLRRMAARAGQASVAAPLRATARIAPATRPSALPLWMQPKRWNSTAAAAATAAPATPAAPTAGEPVRRKYETVYTAPPATPAASRPSVATNGDYALPHPIWTAEYLESVKVTHQKPTTFLDSAALYTIKAIRFNFDWMSGFSLTSKRTEKLWLSRIIFLETVAAVPGSIAATLRHLASLRRMHRDHGWIHSLLEEAENERIHLLTAIALRHPGPLFRAAITITQGIFYNFYWAAYALSPRFCHRLVGYLEEEAVKTYTTLLASIDKGDVFKGTPAPAVAVGYWRLPADATMRDVIANIRADESHHRDVNHEFADMTYRAQNDPAPLHLQKYPNPFPPGH